MVFQILEETSFWELISTYKIYLTAKEARIFHKERKGLFSPMIRKKFQ